MIHHSITKILDVLKKQIADIDTTIKTMIDTHPDLSEKDKIIQSVLGIGQGTSQVLLSALVGLAPFAKDSGRKSGGRQVQFALQGVL